MSDSETEPAAVAAPDESVLDAVMGPGSPASDSLDGSDDSDEPDDGPARGSDEPAPDGDPDGEAGVEWLG